MSVQTVVRSVSQQFRDLTGLADCAVVGVEGQDQGWRVSVEAVEKVSIPASMDLLGVYLITADANGEILTFARTGLRRRGDMK